MLDDPDKTTKLLAALKAAVPFEVELTEWLASRRKRLSEVEIYPSAIYLYEAMARGYLPSQTLNAPSPISKTVLDFRPIYHRGDLRVQAHIFVAALAFPLTQGRARTPERDTS